MKFVRNPSDKGPSGFRVSGARRHGRLIIGRHKVLKDGLPLMPINHVRSGVADFLPNRLLKDLREKTLQADFLDAHERHLDDAERPLCANDRETSSPLKFKLEGVGN